MTTHEKWKSLSEKTQREAKEVLEFLQQTGRARPDEWKDIVDWYYEVENH